MTIHSWTLERTDKGSACSMLGWTRIDVLGVHSTVEYKTKQGIVREPYAYLCRLIDGDRVDVDTVTAEDLQDETIAGCYRVAL